jgi:hypothetical protein
MKSLNTAQVLRQLQQKAKSEISQELLLKITLDTISDIKECNR